MVEKKRTMRKRKEQQKTFIILSKSDPVTFASDIHQISWSKTRLIGGVIIFDSGGTKALSLKNSDRVCAARRMQLVAFLHARVVELAKHVAISLASATVRIGLVLSLLRCVLRSTRCLLGLLGVGSSRRRWWGCLGVVLLRLSLRLATGTNQFVDTHTSGSAGRARTFRIRRKGLRFWVRSHSRVVGSRSDRGGVSVW